MPTVELFESWAEEAEAEAEFERKRHSPPSVEVIANCLKIVTPHQLNDDENLEEIVRLYTTERSQVPESVAARKLWKKYGESASDESGPNPSNTFAGEKVYMQFISGKEDPDQPDENPFEKLKEQKGLVKSPTGSSRVSGEQAYVPPSLRDGDGKRSELPTSLRSGPVAIRISNLSPSTSDHVVEELVKPFGAIKKLYVAKEKTTGMCRGFAYVHFKSQEDARIAIKELDGRTYDHLILKVHWSKPNNPN